MTMFDPTPAAWRKSSYSHGAQTECVEVAPGTTVGVRDTKNRRAGRLTVSHAAWSAFLSTVKR